MNKKIIKALSAFVINVSIVCLSYGQVHQLPFEKNVNWANEESGNREITFEVKKGTSELNINLKGEISKGSMQLNLKNPEGYKLSGFSLVSSSNDHKPSSKKSLSEKAQRELEIERAKAEERAKTRDREIEREEQRATEREELRQLERDKERERVRSNSYSYSSSSSSSISSSSSSTSKNTDSDVSVEVSVGENEKYETNNVIRVKKHDKSVIKTESNKQGARGEMTKTIDNPEPGIWKVMIRLQGSSGQLKISVE